jgi:hypothetical protein
MGFSLPRDRYEMKRAGYTFQKLSTCKGCKATIEIWKTTRGKTMPFDPPSAPGQDREDAVVHYDSCTTNPRNKKAAQTPASGAPKMSDLKRHTIAFAEANNARAVLVLCDGELHSWALRDGENAEDLRSDLITLANMAKRQTEATR